ncbi:MAG: FtsQ-type POTRA domain-containing protein [Litorimonas sp.]
MAKAGAKPTPKRRVSPIKPDLRGASRMVQSRVLAGYRAATLSRRSMMRTIGSIGLALCLLGVTALWLGGHLSTLRDAAGELKRQQLMAMGFTVQRIDVMGEGRLVEADVRAALGIYEGDYFFGTDVQRAQERVETLPWVDRAVVRRLWPNRVVVQLLEDAPYALFQQDGAIHLTNVEGDIVAPFRPDGQALPDGLRLFIGADAARHAQSISATVQTYPAIWDNTETLTRQASGRWDLTYSDGTLVRLPVDGVPSALRTLSALQDRSIDDLAVIDLRLADRITVTQRPANDS